jgi:hypothetical protein
LDAEEELSLKKNDSANSTLLQSTVMDKNSIFLLESDVIIGERLGSGHFGAVFKG